MRTQLTLAVWTLSACGFVALARPVEEPWRDALVREAKVIRVVDGDTLDAEVVLRYSTEHVGRFRILGIDTWEMTGDQRDRGRLAKARLVELIGDGGRVFLRGGIERDSFGRWLVDIRLPDGTDPVAVLRAEGHEKR